MAALTRGSLIAGPDPGHSAVVSIGQTVVLNAGWLMARSRATFLANIGSRNRASSYMPKLWMTFVLKGLTMKLFLSGAMNNNNIKLVLETSPFALEVFGSNNAKVDVGQCVFPLTMSDGDIILDGKGTVRLTPTDQISGERFVKAVNRARSPLVFAIRDNTPTNSNVFLAVQDPSGLFPGQLRLCANYSNQIALDAANGDNELKIFDAAVDTPRVENQSDGLSVRFTFGRFLVDPAHTQDEVMAWLSAVDKRTDTAPTISSDELATKLIRLKDLLDRQEITRDEFDSLVGQAAIHAVDPIEEENFKQAEAEKSRNAELLAEFQRVWVNVVGSGAPTEIRKDDVFNVLHKAKFALEESSKNPSALINMWVSYGNHGLLHGLLNSARLEKDVRKALKRGRPLPDEIQRAQSRYISEYRSKYRPLYQFAQKMGWRDLPTL